MSTSSSPGSRRRSSRRQYIRRTGTFVFFACVAVSTVLSSMSPDLVVMPVVAGAVALALTHGAAWWMKRNGYGGSRRDRSRPSDSGKARPERIATASSRTVRSDFSPAPDEPRRAMSAGKGNARMARDPARRKRLTRALAVAAVTLPVTALVLVWMCFADRPLVVRSGGGELSMNTYEKVQKLLETHDPRNTAGGTRTIALSQQDLNVVVDYAAKRFHDASARVALRPGTALVQASVRTPWSPFGEWLNFDAVLRETGGVPVIDKIKIGSLRVPAFIADVAIEQAISQSGASERGRIAKEMVKSVALTDSHIQVVYEWREDLVNRARATLISSDDQARFHAYSERLFETVERGGRSQSIALAQVLPSMFLLAKQRSAGGEPAKENRAAIITLAFFAFGRDLSTIIPAAASWRAPVPVELTLNGRDDTAQHFLVSAALAIEGGGPLADAIGVYREVDDSRRTGKGKGFSFLDLLADRAGTRFGTLAATSAEKLQRSLAPGIKESDFMPAFGNLAEEIPEAEFKKRYGGVGSPTYNNILADIEGRVARAPLLR